jgi:hypothetical protein
MQRRAPIAECPSAHIAHSRTTEARAQATGFVELDGRDEGGYTVSLQWHRETGETQVTVRNTRTASQIVLPVPAANAGDAFRNPFRAFSAAVQALCEPEAIARL